MAVVEYMMHRINGGNRRHVPDFIGDRGYHPSPLDHSMIGWVDDNPDYYVPDTITSLTKEEFVQRQLTIHASHPYQHPPVDPATEGDDMTDAEVRSMMETWYDNFVTENS
jgi:hypothetical protein